MSETTSRDAHRDAVELAHNIFRYVTTHPDYAEMSDRDIVTEAFRLILGGDDTATRQAFNIIEPLVNQCVSVPKPPEFAAFVDSRHSYTFVIGKWDGSRYVEFCRTTKEQWRDVLARLSDGMLR